jgi:hypothetical protein
VAGVRGLNTISRQPANNVCGEVHRLRVRHDFPFRL